MHLLCHPIPTPRPFPAPSPHLSHTQSGHDDVDHVQFNLVTLTFSPLVRVHTTNALNARITQAFAITVAPPAPSSNNKVNFSPSDMSSSTCLRWVVIVQERGRMMKKKTEKNFCRAFFLPRESEIQNFESENQIKDMRSSFFLIWLSSFF